MSAAPTLTLNQGVIAQARYALHEKLIRCKASLDTAREVFPETSANVRFWHEECTRVGGALGELGGAP